MNKWFNLNVAAVGRDLFSISSFLGINQKFIRQHTAVLSSLSNSVNLFFFYPNLLNDQPVCFSKYYKIFSCQQQSVAVKPTVKLYLSIF